MKTKKKVFSNITLKFHSLLGRKATTNSGNNSQKIMNYNNSN